MLRLYIICMVVFGAQLVQAQQSVKIYLNDRYEKTNEIIATMYRLTSLDKDKRYHGITEDYYKGDILKSRGFYNHGKKVGLWEEYSGKYLVEKRYFEEDTLKFTIDWLSDKKDSIYIKPDKKAVLNGKRTGFLEYKALVSYPEAARQKRIQGKVVASFIILENGEVSSITIENTSNYKILDNAVISHLQRMPDFSPAEEDGRKVKMKITASFVFKLTKSNKSKKK